MFWLIAAAIAALAHLVPFPFVFDVTDRTIWRMPASEPPTIYLTFDDGPNPTATPALLDVLRQHGARATFFVIDKHLTDATAPIVRRAIEEGHAVALHSDSRAWAFESPSAVAEGLTAAAARLERLTGHRPCAAFRPHAGTRSVPLLMGAARAGYRVVGWGFRLWDFNWFRRPTAEAVVPRLLEEADAGEIIVLHDGHHEDPAADRLYTIDTVNALVPELRARGFAFGTICPVRDTPDEGNEEHTVPIDEIAQPIPELPLAGHLRDVRRPIVLRVHSQPAEVW